MSLYIWALIFVGVELGVGATIAGYQSKNQGKGIRNGFDNYINHEWAQHVAISMALVIVTRAGQAIANAFRANSLSELYSKAEQARTDLINITPGANEKSVAIGAFDIKTGQVVADFAVPIPETIDPILLKRAKSLGGIGSRGLTKRNTVGVCAEFRSANTLLLNGSKIENIRFTQAIRPRTGQIIPTCNNCLRIFEEAFK